MIRLRVISSLAKENPRLLRQRKQKASKRAPIQVTVGLNKQILHRKTKAGGPLKTAMKAIVTLVPETHIRQDQNTKDLTMPIKRERIVRYQVRPRLPSRKAGTSLLRSPQTGPETSPTLVRLKHFRTIQTRNKLATICEVKGKERVRMNRILCRSKARCHNKCVYSTPVSKRPRSPVFQRIYP